MYKTHVFIEKVSKESSETYEFQNSLTYGFNSALKDFHKFFGVSNARVFDPATRIILSDVIPTKAPTLVELAGYPVATVNNTTYGTGFVEFYASFTPPGSARTINSVALNRNFTTAVSGYFPIISVVEFDTPIVQSTTDTVNITYRIYTDDIFSVDSTVSNQLTRSSFFPLYVPPSYDSDTVFYRLGNYDGNTLYPNAPEFSTPSITSATDIIDASETFTCSANAVNNLGYFCNVVAAKKIALPDANVNPRLTFDTKELAKLNSASNFKQNWYSHNSVSANYYYDSANLANSPWKPKLSGSYVAEIPLGVEIEVPTDDNYQIRTFPSFGMYPSGIGAEASPWFLKDSTLKNIGYYPEDNVILWFTETKLVIENIVTGIKVEFDQFVGIKDAKALNNGDIVLCTSGGIWIIENKTTVQQLSPSAGVCIHAQPETNDYLCVTVDGLVSTKVFNIPSNIRTNVVKIAADYDNLVCLAELSNQSNLHWIVNGVSSSISAASKTSVRGNIGDYYNGFWVIYLSSKSLIYDSARNLVLDRVYTGYPSTNGNTLNTARIPNTSVFISIHWSSSSTFYRKVCFDLQGNYILSNFNYSRNPLFVNAERLLAFTNNKLMITENYIASCYNRNYPVEIRNQLSSFTSSIPIHTAVQSTPISGLNIEWEYLSSNLGLPLKAGDWYNTLIGKGWLCDGTQPAVNVGFKSTLRELAEKTYTLLPIGNTSVDFESDSFVVDYTELTIDGIEATAAYTSIPPINPLSISVDNSRNKLLFHPDDVGKPLSGKIQYRKIISESERVDIPTLKLVDFDATGTPASFLEELRSGGMQLIPSWTTTGVALTSNTTVKLPNSAYSICKGASTGINTALSNKHISMATSLLGKRDFRLKMSIYLNAYHTSNFSIVNLPFGIITLLTDGRIQITIEGQIAITSTVSIPLTTWNSVELRRVAGIFNLLIEGNVSGAGYNLPIIGRSDVIENGFSIAFLGSSNLYHLGSLEIDV